MCRAIFTVTAALSGLLISGALLAEQNPDIDPETGLTRWQWDSGKASFTFNQRLPDQTRAYFQGRGFKPDEAEIVASGCLFQAIVRTHAQNDKPLQIDLSDWRVVVDGEALPLKLEHEWQQIWQKHDVQRSARIAFGWSLFPTQQRFAPGDWNMGMITLGLSPGDRFDLQISYQLEDEVIQTRLRGMQCAEDKQF